MGKEGWWERRVEKGERERGRGSGKGRGGGLRVKRWMERGKGRQKG